MKRAAFYVDGFNFYHAIDNLREPHLKWMCYRSLAELLIQRNEAVEFVKVFTALATHKPRAMVRHRVVLRAWEARGCKIIMGEFKKKYVHCKLCGQSSQHHEEKRSDVNIALHLLEDCRSGLMDVAYVVTTDSDITPAFEMCSRIYPHVEVVTVAPPGRSPCKALKALAKRSASVSSVQVESCLMPSQITSASGSLIIRPAEYDPPV